VAAGNVTRFRRSDPDRIVRSRRPAHPAIVTVDDFTDVQLRRRSRAAEPLRGAQPGSWFARPGGPPRNAYLPEAAVLEQLNHWLCRLFAPENVDQTVTALLASQHGHAHHEKANDQQARKRHADAEASIRRFQAAIEAGIDPAALVDAVNRALAQRDAARAELDNEPVPHGLNEAEIRAMVDYLGDVGASLNGADPAKLETLYEALRLEMVYDAEQRAVDVVIRPARRGSARVRGGT
jgi:hypothetical protein